MGNSAQLKEARARCQEKAPRERQVSAGSGKRDVTFTWNSWVTLLKGVGVWEQKVTQSDHLAFETLDPGLFMKFCGQQYLTHLGGD